MSFKNKVINHFQIPLFKNAYFLITNALATSGLGFIFWKLVANQYSVNSIGNASGYLSTVGLISSIAQLGLGFGIIHYLPQLHKPSLRIKLLNSSLAFTGIASIITSTIYLLFARTLTPALDYISSSIGHSIFLVFFTVVWTWYGLGDQIFAAYRNGKYVLKKNLITNLLKIPLPFFVFTSPLFGIPLSIAISMFIAIVWILYFAIKNFEPSYYFQLRISSEETREVFYYSIPNYISAWLWQTPNLLLPIIILNTYGSKSNGEFFLSFMIASLLNVIGSSLATSLFTEGSYEPKNLNKNLIRALIISMTLQAFSLFLIFEFGSYILRLFGESYVIHAFDMLKILSISSFGYTLISIASTLFRIRKQYLSLIVFTSIPLMTLIIAILTTNQLNMLLWVYTVGMIIGGIMAIANSLRAIND